MSECLLRERSSGLYRLLTLQVQVIGINILKVPRIPSKILSPLPHSQGPYWLYCKLKWALMSNVRQIKIRVNPLSVQSSNERLITINSLSLLLGISELTPKESAVSPFGPKGQLVGVLSMGILQGYIMFICLPVSPLITEVPFSRGDEQGP